MPAVKCQTRVTGHLFRILRFQAVQVFSDDFLKISSKQLIHSFITTSVSHQIVNVSKGVKLLEKLTSEWLIRESLKSYLDNNGRFTDFMRIDKNYYGNNVLKLMINREKLIFCEKLTTWICFSQLDMFLIYSETDLLFLIFICLQGHFMRLKIELISRVKCLHLLLVNPFSVHELFTIL